MQLSRQIYNSPIICPECWRRIQLNGLPATSILHQVCIVHKQNLIENCMKFQVVYEPGNYPLEPAAYWLECSGYIVTSEANDKYVLCVPNMLTCMYIDPPGYFCWCQYFEDYTLHDLLDTGEY